jgi:hypothetical protein
MKSAHSEQQGLGSPNNNLERIVQLALLVRKQWLPLKQSLAFLFPGIPDTILGWKWPRRPVKPSSLINLDKTLTKLMLEGGEISCTVLSWEYGCLGLRPESFRLLAGWAHPQPPWTHNQSHTNMHVYTTTHRYMLTFFPQPECEETQTKAKRKKYWKFLSQRTR